MIGFTRKVYNHKGNGGRGGGEESKISEEGKKSKILEMLEKFFFNLMDEEKNPNFEMRKILKR